VTTSPGVTTHVTFGVSCVQTGSVRVTTTTTGANLDPDGYGVWLNGNVLSVRHRRERVAHVRPVAARQLRRDARSLATNCSISGPTSKSVTVNWWRDCGRRVRRHVRTACGDQRDGGDDRRRTRSGRLCRHGSEPGREWLRSGAVAPNGAVVLDSLNQGTYSVTLSGVAGNCT